MCVICVKPKGVEMPPWEAIENCFDSNPNGAGFALIRDGMVEVKKGFFVYEDYKQAIQEAGVSKEEPFLMHMRIATHGGFGHECTHPFPITHSWNDMHKKEYRASSVFAHNGVFSNMEGTSKEGRISDTMVFVRMLAETGLHVKAKDNDYWRNVLYRTIGVTNKVAIMYKTGEVLVNGGSWEEKYECMFSNNSYKFGCSYGFHTNYKSDKIWEDPYDPYYGLLDDEMPETWEGDTNGNVDEIDKDEGRVHFVEALADYQEVFDIGNGMCPLCRKDLRRRWDQKGNRPMFRCISCKTDWTLTDTDLRAIKDVFPDFSYS